MNRQNLINLMQSKSSSSTTKKALNETLDLLMETIIETVAKGEKVTLVGFGTFEPVSKPARVTINPQTREAVQVPARTVPRFKVGKNFKEAVADPKLLKNSPF